MMRRGLAFSIVTFIVFAFAPGASALSLSFSDQDFLGGASWGTMIIEAVDADSLSIRFEAAPASVIPAGSRVSGFAFDFDVMVSSVRNPGDDDFIADRNDLDWIALNNLSAIPNPANRDEFSP